MGPIILAIALAVLLALVIAYKTGGTSMFDDDCEVETVTTTTSYQDGRPVVGDLQRRREGAQFFVIDPADQQKIWINDQDDFYEDANDRIWRLV